MSAERDWGAEARWYRSQRAAMEERQARHERITRDHVAAHDRAQDCERRAVEALSKGDTAAAIALGLLAVSARLDEVASEVEDVAGAMPV